MQWEAATSDAAYENFEDDDDLQRLTDAAASLSSLTRALLVFERNGTLEIAAATMSASDRGRSRVFSLTSPAVFDANVVRRAIDTGKAQALENAAAIPVRLADGIAALYLDGPSSLEAIGRVEWLASTFSVAMTAVSLEQELRAVREEATKVQGDLELARDMIPALAWIASSEGRFQEASRSWHEYTGISHEEAVGTGFLKAFHPDDVEKVHAAWMTLLAERRAGGVEARILRHDGQARYHMLRAVPRFDDEGRIVKWYGIDSDIDDLKRAEFELAKSKAVMAEAQKIIQTGSWSWDMSTNVFTCSTECANIVGNESETISFKAFMDKVHPDDRTMVAEAHERALQGDELNVEHRFVLPDGSSKFVHARGRIISDEHGNGRSYIGTIVDVTEARRSSEQIKTSLADAQRAQASLAEAQKLSHVGSYRILAETREIIWSEETYRIYGLDPNEPLTPEAVMGRMHPDDRARVEEVFAQGLRDRVPWEVEHRLVMPDGTIKHVHCVTRIGTDPGEKPEAFGAILDLTERVKSEEALRKAQDDIVRMNRMTAMGAMSISIAHEMNQPLMSIITDAATCLSWLDRETPDLEEAKAVATRVIKETKRAGDVLHNVRNMGRNSRPTFADIDLNCVVGDVLTMLRSEFRTRGIEVIVSLSPELRRIQGDKVQLQQVLMNLMLNAAEAMEPSSECPAITVGTRTSASFVTLAVEDNGHGIDPLASDRIFEAFYSTKPEGTGMGLAICRSIVEAHGGSLSARPRTPHGSIFEFSIPYPKVAR